jgi:hypothetical protein
MFRKLKNKIKQSLLSVGERKKLASKQIEFPGGVVPIHLTEPEDVFIVGFPKSGNTLMQHIIAHLVYGFNEESSRSMINLVTSDVYASTHYFRFNKICYFKSHERPQPNYKRVIYLIRDGREALLSYYHMMQNLDKKVSLEDLYSGKVSIYGGLWHEHIEAWEKNPYQAEMLWVKFEDLKNDKLKILKQVCDFLDLERSDEELKKVMELTSLEHMKELEKRKDWSKMKHDVSFEKGTFVRKGAIDSYKEEAPELLVKIFEGMSKNKHYDYN